jgi:hypothetical protein
VTGDFLDTPKSQNSKFVRSIKNWRIKLSPVFGAAILGLFLYWIWIYRGIIADTFKKAGVTQLAILIIFIVISGVLTVYALVILVRDKGYTFGFADGYHSLNLSQLASMIPGGIWGYAGFAGFLWSKGISKIDSIIIIFVYTLVMLSACAIVGVSGLIAVLGWGYAVVCFLPFFFLLFGRDWLDKLRQKYYPESSRLPSASALLKVLFLGIVIWTITSSCFAWLLYTSDGTEIIPFWTVIGAYATGYLGGYISILVPSGLGVSEGLVALMLGLYIGADRILAVAISFRIINTLITWSNILLSVFLTSNQAKKNS